MAALTDALIRKTTCPSDKKRVRLFDSGGMYLEVAPTGSKRWFLKFYKPDGKESRLALGTYPLMTLAQARAERDKQKVALKSGVNVVVARKKAKVAQAATSGLFREVAQSWYAKNKSSWSVHHQVRELRNIEKDLNPRLGNMLVSDIDTPLLLACLKKVEERTVDVAHRVAGTAKGIFTHAVLLGFCKYNPATEVSKGLQKKIKKNYGAVTKQADTQVLANILKAIKTYRGSIQVREALSLAPMLFQRPGNIRTMEWSEVDLEKAMWVIPASKMKRNKESKLNGDPHYVPLPKQAVAKLIDLKGLTGISKYVFPSPKTDSRPLSDNAMRSALLSLGFTSDIQTVHGFRATARTILDEQLEFPPHLIEAQLAHSVKDANGVSYNRTEHLLKRAEIMQAWADWLDDIMESEHA